MKKIILSLFLMAAAFGAMAQDNASDEPVRNLQFSLPIWPEKVWPSEYANYNADVHNCCDWLLNAAAGYNSPKREECTNFLLRWLEGTPEVRVYLVDGLVDPKNGDLLVAYMAAWTRHALDNPDDNPLICANVAVSEMLVYYEANIKVIGKSKPMEKLLKLRSQSKLAPHVKQCLLGK